MPLIRSYTWGLDLADSFEEAGGVGGLLIITDHIPSDDTYYFPTYDGNGNVTGLVRSSGTPTALYEYSPFGEHIRSTGPAARLNPFQFSTKYLDHETGLSYYGHRYYIASLGRWINRDPIEEEDGPNLYAHLRNNSYNGLDALGLRNTRNRDPDKDARPGRHWSRRDGKYESGIAHDFKNAGFFQKHFLMLYLHEGDGPLNYKRIHTRTHLKSMDTELWPPAFLTGSPTFLMGVHAAGAYYGLGAPEMLPQPAGGKY